jgi:hypothetical protein
LILRLINQVAGGAHRCGYRRWTAALTFSAGNRLLALSVTAGSDVNQGDFRMISFGPFVSRLSVVTAYLAFAFVCAIVLGVF